MSSPADGEEVGDYGATMLLSATLLPFAMCKKSRERGELTMQRNLIRQVAKSAAVFLARFPFQSVFWKFQSATRGTRMAGSKRLWRSSVSPVGMVPRLLVMCVLSCCSACRGQCLARARRAAAQARSHGALRSLVGDIERLSRVLDRANVRSHPAAVAFCSRCGVPTALPSQGATHLTVRSTPPGWTPSMGFRGRQR